MPGPAGQRPGGVAGVPARVPRRVRGEDAGEERGVPAVPAQAVGHDRLRGHPELVMLERHKQAALSVDDRGIEGCNKNFVNSLD